MPAPPAPKPAAPPSLDAFPCKLGDVILRSAGDEAWLAGALVLREGDEPAAACSSRPKRAPIARARAAPRARSCSGSREEKSVRVPLGEPPTALEVGTDRYERRVGCRSAPSASARARPKWAAR